MSDAHKNFAYSTVATAPSPATSGTSLVVAAGDGTKFPAAPFNVTIWPTGVQPTTSNAEVARVTAVSTDTFTITRAQESSAARTVVVGDQIQAGITAKTLQDVEGVANAAYTPGGTDVAIADGGTNASSASSARTNLGLAIGTDVQAWNSKLDSWVSTGIPTADLQNGSVTPDKLNLGLAVATVNTSESLTSTSYTDLTTSGPAVTVTVGANGFLQVGIWCSMTTNTAGQAPRMGFAMSGANTQSAADSFSILNNLGTDLLRCSSVFVLSGLTPGSITLTAKYRSGSSGNATFTDRRIWAIPY